LSERYDVYILSTAPWRNPTACNDKLHWIHQHFGKEEDSCLYKRLILSHHKDLNRGEILIDDRPHKNGAEKFPRVLHFGVPPYDTWEAVEKALL
jgi:5'(3')-deoxyribonucleotidase